MNLNLTISPNVRVWSSVESKIVDMQKQIQEHVLCVSPVRSMDGITLASQLSYVLEENSGAHDI